MQYYNKMAKTKEREKKCYECGELIKEHYVLKIGKNKLITCRNGKHSWREKI